MEWCGRNEARYVTTRLAVERRPCGACGGEQRRTLASVEGLPWQPVGPWACAPDGRDAAALLAHLHAHAGLYRRG